MKHVVILGAAGHTGRYITKKISEMEQVNVSAFVRNPEKLGDEARKKIRVIQGDALKADDVKMAMEGQDVLLCRCSDYGKEHNKSIAGQQRETNHLDHRNGNPS